MTHAVMQLSSEGGITYNNNNNSSTLFHICVCCVGNVAVSA